MQLQQLNMELKLPTMSPHGSKKVLQQALSIPPPLAEFRVNPLIAVAQSGKVRPVLDVSRPEGKSLNSAVEDLLLEKVKMTSAKEFGDLLLKTGKDSIFSKTDLVAAYKQVPCKVENLRLQGFKWLGKYFIETRQIFGAKTSVTNFDIVGETLRTLAIAQSGIRREFTLRQLDDLIVVAPDQDASGTKFTVDYKRICDMAKVELADDCKKCEKAFTGQKRGKVLGIFFDSTDLTWALPEDKRQKCLNAVKKVLNGERSTLLDVQKMLGRINDVGQMCPFMKVFKFSLNKSLVTESEDPDQEIIFQDSALEDLKVWAGLLESQLRWLPICPLKNSPPLRCMTFYSDAAGLASDTSAEGGPGCGSVGFDEDGIIIFARQLIWPKEFIETSANCKNVRYGDNSACLEMIGVLLPFISSPELCAHKRVLFKVDNLSVVYGIMNGLSTSDESTSILIRTIYLIAAYIECEIFVEHVNRKSNWESNMADRLSRLSTTTKNDVRLLDSFKFKALPMVLQSWMEHPTESWNLAYELLDWVENELPGR